MRKHTKPESERFKGTSKWCQYVLVRGLLTLLLQRLPIRFAYKFGQSIGWLCWKLLKKRREVVSNNLRVANIWIQKCRITDEAPDGWEHLPDLHNQVREVFLRSGANLFSGFCFNTMSPARMAEHIDVEGLEHLEGALSEGRGALFLLAHMGPWEALSQFSTLAKDYGIEAQFGAIYRPLNNAYLDRWIKQVREARGMSLYSRRDGFHRSVEFLKSGGVLGVLADQKMHQGVAVEFFGEVCKTSPLPGLFQRRSGVPMIALSLQTLGIAKWRIRLTSVDLLPIENDRSRESEARITNRELEKVFSVSPLDVFWFHNRFR
ncbi:MAG: lysophospholipid acyltransferase family protein [Lentimonas sp.]